MPYESVAIDLANRPAWIIEQNPPDGRVPVLEEDGWVLPESAVIDEYLDERYPEPPLLPADPAERAAARFIVFRFDDFAKPYYALRRGEPGADADLAAELAALDALLAAMPYLTGRGVRARGRRLPAVGDPARDLMGVSLEPYPAVRGWIASVLRAAVRGRRDRDRRVARGVTDVTARRARRASRRAGPRAARRAAGRRVRR